MSEVLAKVQQLEKYIRLLGDPTQKQVWELALDKLLAREIADITAQKAHLETQLTEFEHQYNLSSKEFYARFERGELGDDADLIEWSATFEMVQNLQRRLDALATSEDTEHELPHRRAL